MTALAGQAERAGGQVHNLMGNHEAMNLLGIRRDVNAEAYAAFVDDESEAGLADAWDVYATFQANRALAAGRTAVIISHRLTTAMKADIIHVMEKGKIVESGAHHDLLQGCINLHTLSHDTGRFWFQSHEPLYCYGGFTLGFCFQHNQSINTVPGKLKIPALLPCFGMRQFTEMKQGCGVQR